MYMMKKDAELNLIELGTLLAQFQTSDLPKLNEYYNYFLGKQKILQKVASDVGKPCNNVVVNYCSGIVDNYVGYICGQPIAYNSKQDIEDIIQTLNYNDVRNNDTSFLRNACIFGRASEIMWIDYDGQVRFKQLDPREVVAIYDDTLEQELLYAVRFYRNKMLETPLTDEFIVEVYDKATVRRYRSTPMFSSFTFIDERPHFFKQVPVTFFDLNDEQKSSFDRIMSMQDAYNVLVSSSIDDWEAFCDAYLVLKGVVADEDDLIAMKQNRVLMIDADANAGYLTKERTDANIQNLLQLLNDQIHLVALSPDFNDEKFMAQSGVALKYKLIGFENMAGNIENHMRKALQRRIELICEVLELKGGEEKWRDIQITFNRNLPANETEVADIVNKLRGLVSNETLLSQISFVVDPKEEAKKVEEQNSISLYDQENFNEVNDGLLEEEASR